MSTIHTTTAMLITKQKRYERTPKGKQARGRATANYDAQFIEWKTRRGDQRMLAYKANAKN